MISGKMGEVFIPKLHSLQTVKSIVIFCFKTEMYLHLKTKYEKVKLITKDFEEAKEQCLLELSGAMGKTQKKKSKYSCKQQ